MPPADLPPDGPELESPYDARPWLASYPDGVPSDFDFPSVPVTRLLDDAAASFPTSTAVSFLGSRLTYRALVDQVDRCATALAGLGVGPGDRVALVLPNCPQFVVTFFATLRLGAVAVPHNPLYTAPELRALLADSGARVVVCLDRFYDTVAQVRADTAVEHVVVTSLADYLPRGQRLALQLPLRSAKRRRERLVAPVARDADVRQLLPLLRAARTGASQAPVEPATTAAVLQYTGGTTGASKAALLTHRNLVSAAYMSRLWDPQATAGREVCLGVLPLFHVFGLSAAMMSTVLLGGTLVLLPRFDLDEVLDTIETERPTMLPGVPPIFRAIAASPGVGQRDLRSLRICISGAMRLPPDVQERFERVTGARLVEGYGLTETSPTTHCNPITGERRPGSIGLPLPGTVARVVDPDDPAVEVPPGQPGELVIEGPQVFPGYWGQSDADPTSTAQVGVFTAAGGLLTGDIAVMDDDGWFSLVDRKKELIIAGGFNVYPSEVESVVSTLPGVAEAVAVGVPDRYRGETVKVYVVPAPGAALTEEDVVEHCSAALTPYKVPKLVEFREELPRSAVGKVLRRVLLEEERAKATAAEVPPPASVPGGVRDKPVGKPPADK